MQHCPLSIDNLVSSASYLGTSSFRSYASKVVPVFPYSSKSCTKSEAAGLKAAATGPRTYWGPVR
jgi:hypothetical protein